MVNGSMNTWRPASAINFTARRHNVKTQPMIKTRNLPIPTQNVHTASAASHQASNIILA